MGHARGDLADGWGKMIAEIRLMGEAVAGRVGPPVVERHEQPTTGHEPPINLRLVEVPRLDDAGIHHGMAQLAKAFTEPGIGHANELFKIAALVRMAHQRLHHRSVDLPQVCHSILLPRAREPMARAPGDAAPAARSWRHAAVRAIVS